MLRMPSRNPRPRGWFKEVYRLGLGRIGNVHHGRSVPHADQGVFLARFGIHPAPNFADKGRVEDGRRICDGGLGRTEILTRHESREINILTRAGTGDQPGRWVTPEDTTTIFPRLVVGDKVFL